jgi:mono/diheme cytochrome c family protein
MPLSRPLLALALVLMSASVTSAQDDPQLVRQGREVLATQCSRCHAIDPTGNSPHRDAPPFRMLSQRYPIEYLAEALAEGLSTGHPDMPEFVFEIQEVSAILAYLQSIQTATTAPRSKR